MKKYFINIFSIAVILLAGCTANSVDFTENPYSPLFTNSSQLQIGFRAKPYDDKLSFNFGYAIDSSTGIFFSTQKIESANVDCKECGYFLKEFFEIGLGQHSIKLSNIFLEYFVGVSKGRSAYRQLIDKHILFSEPKLIRSETDFMKYNKYFLQVTLHGATTIFQNAGTIKLSYFTMVENYFVDYNFQTTYVTEKFFPKVNPIILDVFFTNAINFSGDFLGLKVFGLVGIHYPLKKNNLTKGYFWFGAGTSLMLNF